jgi:phosphatidate cytidylyltransferase
LGFDIRHDDPRKYRGECQIHRTRGESRIVSEQKAAPAVAPGQDSNLSTRVVAALVLAPVTIVCAHVGGWLWIALVTVAAIGLFVEWLMVAGMARVVRLIASGAAALIFAGIFLAIGWIAAAASLLGLGLVVVALLAPQRRAWSGAGLLYAGAAQMSSVLVRLDRVEGFVALTLILLVVWVTDIGGYFAGRNVGGPKLWPRVSPNKTWAGAIGGFVGSLMVATIFAAFGFGKVWPMLLVGAALSIASQLGDLFESAVKRHFGVKDSSHIIPGHGGLMDRLDGFIAAIVLAAIFGLLRGGPDGVGRALMVW